MRGATPWLQCTARRDHSAGLRAKAAHGTSVMSTATSTGATSAKRSAEHAHPGPGQRVFSKASASVQRVVQASHSYSYISFTRPYTQMQRCTC